MIIKDYLPSRDTDLIDWMRNFAAVVSATPSAFGTTAPVVTALNTAIDLFDGAFASVITNAEVLRGLVQDKEDAKDVAVAAVRNLARQIQANPSVTSGQKATAGLPVHSSSRAPVPTYVVSGFVANPDVSGNINLKWDRNGNKPGTNFLIQSAPSATGPWVTVEVTQRKSFVLTDQPVGELQYFRIIASRPKSSSAPSAALPVWNTATGTMLKLAA